MWVLSTDRAELHYVSSPDDVNGGYAILSHVWGKSEQTFEEIQKLAKQYKGSGINPLVSSKIKECCRLAQKHGYEWIWSDTCCIDKRSSAELSEAINSMFRYYSLAKVCYAYLSDVPSDDVSHADDSAFRKSRWHKRGWTLQELIAPNLLIFVSRDWHPLGGRTELADLLEKITNVPAPLLRLEKKVNDYSVAQRMSWAAWRETTRVEDRAYSLMGIFGIHMPTLYGEGENAFRRLQEEIMRRSVDPSLFLWGFINSLDLETMEAAPSPCDHEGGRSHLLTTSPDEFGGCSEVVSHPFGFVGMMAAQIQELELTESQTAASRFITFLLKHLPTFALTQYGVRAHVPVVRGSKGVLVSILSCFRRGYPLGLILSPCTHRSDPSYPLYHTGISYRMRAVVFDDIRPLRLVFDEPIAALWKEVYIAPWPPVPNPIPALLINTMFSPPFRISEVSMSNIYEGEYRLHSVSPMSPTWTGSPPIVAVFRRRRTDIFMAIRLGRCGSHPENIASLEPGRLGPHWAAIRFHTSEDDALGPELPGHTCPDDHIDLWPDRSKRIKDPHKTHPWRSLDWLLSFAPCRINPNITLIACLSLIKTHF